ncbi:hypothetical protein JZ751_029919 [Albula glossodonta]|uniref:B box-type domain-containing protein n=1 Tax=Albula glossodonta TaxID=121402 RepID=A0A8T2N9B9_9TELE|nr:hypothetical protein JZ751_029919 [Albula glossodonta]
MNGLGGAAEWGRGEEEEEELPQSDGTCDACEPDEAQPATQVCHTCSFAFCAVHADKHLRSTRHDLEPYSPTQAEERKEGTARGGGDGGGSGDEGGGEEDEAAGQAPEPAEAGKGRDTVTVERLRCKEHGQEGSLYCKRDEKIVCVVCVVQGEHRHHEIITLREAYLWQKSKGGIDLISSTQEMAERIKSKWTSPDLQDFATKAVSASEWGSSDSGISQWVELGLSP